MCDYCYSLAQLDRGTTISVDARADIFGTERGAGMTIMPVYIHHKNVVVEPVTPTSERSGHSGDSWGLEIESNLSDKSGMGKSFPYMAPFLKNSCDPQSIHRLYFSKKYL